MYKRQVEDFISRGVDNTLVIATAATINSHKYPDTIDCYQTGIEVFTLPTPKSVSYTHLHSYCFYSIANVDFWLF